MIIKALLVSDRRISPSRLRQRKQEEFKFEMCSEKASKWQNGVKNTTYKNTIIMDGCINWRPWLTSCVCNYVCVFSVSCMHVSMHRCTYMYACVCNYVCTYAQCTYALIHVCMLVFTCKSVCTYVCLPCFLSVSRSLMTASWFWWLGNW